MKQDTTLLKPEASDSTLVPVRLHELPERVLERIAGFALFPDDSESGALTPGSTSSSESIRFARTHPRLRNAACHVVSSLDYGSSCDAWPAVRALAPGAWPQLKDVRVTIDRSKLCGFLKWLVGGTSVRSLHINVVGERYPQSSLWDLERMLIGRLFTQLGHDLEVLVVSGIDTKSLLMSVACRCTKLRQLELDYFVGGDANTSAASPLCLYLFTIVCMVSSKHLRRIRVPLDGFQENNETPSGSEALEVLENTWSTLWGNYQAGAKEALTNLPEDETKMVDLFRRVMDGMKGIEATMRERVLHLRSVASSLTADRMPYGMLMEAAPLICDINLVSTPRTTLSQSLAQLGPHADRVQTLCLDEKGRNLLEADFVALKEALPTLDYIELRLCAANDGSVNEDFEHTEAEGLDTMVESYRGASYQTCETIQQFCRLLDGQVMHVGLTVSGSHSVACGLTTSVALWNMKKPLDSLHLRMNGLTNAGLAAVLERHGETLGELSIGTHNPGTSTTSPALALTRRMVLNAVAMHCTTGALDTLQLPPHMAAPKDQISAEVRRGLDLAISGFGKRKEGEPNKNPLDPDQYPFLAEECIIEEGTTMAELIDGRLQHLQSVLSFTS